jgi:hypothetical protein
MEEVRQRLQLERRLIARLNTANIRFSDAQVERIWAIVSAHQAGLSIRKIAGVTGLSSTWDRGVRDKTALSPDRSARMQQMDAVDQIENMRQVG